MHRGRRRQRGERGGELIEVALVSLSLVVLLLGSIEFGRAFYTYNILTKAVRNAARYLSASQISYNGTIGTQYRANTQQMAVYGQTSGGTIPVVKGLLPGNIIVPAAATHGTSPTQFYVEVRADYTYTPLFKFPLSSVKFEPKVTMLFVGRITGPS